MSWRVPTGQPFRLRGTRIVFSDYRYIRPAGLGWYAPDGRNVSVVGDSRPLEAEFRTSDEPRGIRIQAFQAMRPEAPLKIPALHPWESEGIRPGTIVADPDQGGFRLYGTCRADGVDRPCLLTSRDLDLWDRPEIGLVGWESRTGTNLLLSDRKLGHVFHDPSGRDGKWKWISEGTLTRDELDRYLALRGGEWDPRANRTDVVQGNAHVGSPNMIVCVRGGISEDGLSWTTLAEPLVVEHSDTIVTAYFDQDLDRYVGYFRDWSAGPSADGYEGPGKGLGWMAGRRSIGRAESESFRHFPLSEVIAEPGPPTFGPSDTFYTNGHAILPGTGDQHAFLATIWHQANDSTSVHLAVSTDGRNLNWLPGNPVLDTHSFGHWDGGCVFATGHLLEVPGGDWLMPYQAFNLPHKYPRKGGLVQSLGLMRWPRGRMAAVAAEEDGQFTTMSFIPPGRRIGVNADIRRGGRLRIEACDMQGKAYPGCRFEDCRPMTGDLFDAEVPWRDGGSIPGRLDEPVTLRVRLSQGRLFHLDFKE